MQNCLIFYAKLSHFLCKIVSFFTQNCLIFYAKLSHFLRKIVSFFTQNCLIFYANTCTLANTAVQIWAGILMTICTKSWWYSLHDARHQDAMLGTSWRYKKGTRWWSSSGGRNADPQNLQENLLVSLNSPPFSF